MTYVKVNNPINKSFDGLMNEVFNELPTNFGKSLREDVLHFPPANIIENNEQYKIEMAAPGMDKADFKINLDDKILTITADKKAATETKEEKLIRKEFSYKSFNRSFTMDEKIDSANITARYENGILKLELPKREEIKGGAKQITIQ